MMIDFLDAAKIKIGLLIVALDFDFSSISV